MTIIPRMLGAVLSAAAILGSVAATSGDRQVPLTDKGSDGFICDHPPYKTHIISKSPLVIYLDGFLTDFERSHLQDVTKNTFSHSGVASSSGGKAFHQVRTSQSTSVARDAVVRCIEDRALLFQGFDVPRTYLEPLQLVKYGLGERYHFHTDWFTNTAANALARMGGNRATSFFAYVHVENGTMGGGTNFPLVDAPTNRRWCDEGFVDRDEMWENGVTFRPKEGNAIYWENLLPDGRGDPRTLHAGLPVVRGGKIGMNVWTRQAPLSEVVRGTDV